MFVRESYSVLISNLLKTIHLDWCHFVVCY
nr:MAG TPA: Tamulustoxin family protein [Bacteriophage sp.]